MSSRKKYEGANKSQVTIEDIIQVRSIYCKTASLRYACIVGERLKYESNFDILIRLKLGGQYDKCFDPKIDLDFQRKPIELIFSRYKKNRTQMRNSRDKRVTIAKRSQINAKLTQIIKRRRTSKNKHISFEI